MAQQPGSGDHPADGAAQWRLLGFRIAVVLFTAMFLVGLYPALKRIVLNWFPHEAYLRFRPDLAPADVVHRLHSTALAALSWGMVIGVGVQLHAPHRKIGAMLMALAVPPALAVGECLTGTFTVLGTGIPFVLLLAIAFLHPHASRLLRVQRSDAVMTVLALAGAVPWILYAVEQGAQGRLAPGWDVAHYGFVASLGVVVVLWSLLGALGQRGWLWPASAAGIAAAIIARKSLIFPDVLSGLRRGWAVKALVWAGCYLLAAGVRWRRRRSAGAPAVP